MKLETLKESIEMVWRFAHIYDGHKDWICDGKIGLCADCYKEIMLLLSDDEYEVVKQLFIIEGVNDGNESNS